MGAGGYLGSMVSAMAYVLLLAVWGLSVGIVYIHASSHNRSTWLWTLVAFIPIAGILIYFTYYNWKSVSLRQMAKSRHRERLGEYITKPRTKKEREAHEAIAILANYRDPQVEELLIEGNTHDANDIIDKRTSEALSKRDPIAAESYDFYRRALDEYRRSGILPRIIRKLWGMEPDIDEEDEEEEADEAPDEELVEQDVSIDVQPEEDDYPDYEDDRNRWIEV
jgi:hypothetical protein